MSQPKKTAAHASSRRAPASHPPRSSARRVYPVAHSRSKSRSPSRLPAFLQKRAVKRALIAVAIIGVAAALDLTLRSSGYMKLVAWLPAPVADWADAHGQFRNLPAFFLLALPFLALAPRKRHRLLVVAALCLFAALIEAAQLLRPHRWVEWEDVAWSWVGIALAWALFESTLVLLNRLRLTKTVRRLYAAPVNQGSAP